MSVGSLSRTWEDGKRQVSYAINTVFTQTLQLSRDTMASLLHDCSKRKDLDGARCVHSAITECGYDWSAKLGCHLIRIYGCLRLLPDGDHVFQALREQSTNTWTSIISNHADHGLPERAILLYGRMRLSTIKPNSSTLVAALKSCACVEALPEGRLLHSDAMKQGLEVDVHCGNTLIDMYCKCNSLRDACKTFEDMRARNIVSWNSLLGGYLQVEYIEAAAQVLERMHQCGVKPNHVTLIYQLKLFACSKTLDQGRDIHDQVYVLGLEENSFLGNALLNMYAKCNKLIDAYNVFHKLNVQNVIAWSAMIHGYAENGHGEDALKMFVQMRKKGILPDEVTFVCVLKACAAIQALEQGKLIHIDALKCNLALNVFMVSILVVMYVKCGSIFDARRVFDRSLFRNVVSWSSMIEGYVEQGLGEEALKLLKDMHKAGIEPNGMTFLSGLKACTNLGAVDQGKVLHGDVIEQGLDSDLVIGNALIDMYVKGGNLEEAVRVFDTLMVHTVESWSALIAGYANYGNLSLANNYLQAMSEHGVEPDLIAFLGLLYACSHAGLFEEAYLYFKSMIEDHSIAPTREHFACIVDMFSRAGLLVEAETVVVTMPFLPDSVLWKTLLSSCVRHNDVKIGRRAFDSLLDSKCGIAAGYVLMSNVYVANIIDEDLY